MAVLAAKDVAAYILRQHGPMTGMKLQKLLYYSQAWSLAWDKKPLFSDKLKAWKEGPVAPSVWKKHEKEWMLERIPGANASALTDEAVATVAAVLSCYGQMTGDELSDLTHREAPWRLARKSEDTSPTITHQMMLDYFGRLALTSPHKEVSAAVRRGMHLLMATPESEIEDLFQEADVESEVVLRWMESDVGEDS